MNRHRIATFAALLLLAALLAPMLRAAGPGRRHVDLPGRTGNAPYSDAVVVGDTVYLAGRLGLVDGRPPADVEQEVTLILDGMKAVLAAEGMTMDDLVVVQVFCTDVALLERFNAVYRTYFTQGYPARAFVGSGPLLFGARFEVQGTAVRRAPAR